MIDVTPSSPLPRPQFSPVHRNCASEGLVVCDRGRIKGQVGVSLDEMVYLGTKLMRQVDSAGGMDRMVLAAEDIGNAAKAAEPLLEDARRVAEELAPLLNEMQHGNLMKNLDKLTESLAASSSDVKQLSDIMSRPENVKLARQTAETLKKTLENVESVSGDMSVLTHDPAVQANLKRLIVGLSRLVD